MVVYINGCTLNHSGGGHNIERFYLSEDGRFWDEDHKLRFEKEDDLFDYLLTVEYDFHPVITERTYEMLRHFGWYEGRRVDTDDFERELKKRGITLSQIQLDTIREFSGLNFLFSQWDYNQEFSTLEEIIELVTEDDPSNPDFFRPEVYDYNDKSILIGRNVLAIGWDDQRFFSVADDGKIYIEGIEPVGRTALEYIYAFGEAAKKASWL